MREAYQSKIAQRILNSNLCVHLNPNFRESGLHTYTICMVMNLSYLDLILESPEEHLEIVLGSSIERLAGKG